MNNSFSSAFSEFVNSRTNAAYDAVHNSAKYLEHYKAHEDCVKVIEEISGGKLHVAVEELCEADTSLADIDSIACYKLGLSDAFRLMLGAL